MNDPFFQKLRETSWRRKLTASEKAELRAWLAAHPEAKADWEAEARLNQLLGGLLDAPVPSNFTAQVLQAAKRSDTAAARRPAGWLARWNLTWPSLWPKAAFAAAILTAGIGLLSYREAVATKQVKLAQKARSVATVSGVSSLPDPDVLLNFEAIRQLDSKPAVDKGLLAVFSYLQ